MKPGLHIVDTRLLASHREHGLDLPEPWIGVLDLLRMIEGHAPEPEPNRTLVVVGLEALVRAVAAQPVRPLQVVREGLVSARGYFMSKAIPLVFLSEAELTDPRDGTGLRMVVDDREIALAPCFGTRLEPLGKDIAGWWWSAQIG